jgi:mannose-1-phosphate guanylyltransferase
MKIVIFCGGFGTRMWPISRKSHPKQFAKVIRGKSFFQRTLIRFKKRFKPEDILISTEEQYVSFIRKQAPEIPKENLIVEPERRDLLGAVGLVAAVIEKKYPGEVMFFSWSDHFIADEKKFLDAVEAACKHTQITGVSVSVNEKPTYPSVHNGWIKYGKKVGEIGGHNLYEMVKFIEKPKEDRAKRLFKAENYVIHTGYGAWRSDKMLEYYKEYAPDVHRRLMVMMEAMGTKREGAVIKREYHKLRKESVEYGLFEKLPRDLRLTITVETGWEDAGTWELFYKAVIEKGEENVVEGEAVVELLNSKNNLVIGSNKKKLITLVNMYDVVVINTKDALLVCGMHHTDQVKSLFKLLEEKRPKYIK